MSDELRIEPDGVDANPPPDPLITTASVSDFESTSLLRVFGAEFIKCYPDVMNPRRIVFDFKVGPRHIAALAMFKSGSGPQVSASEFWDAIQWCKELVKRNKP